MTIGELIKKSRKEKGWTQKQLADAAGLATITIQQYESGKRIPKVDNLQKLATALEIPAMNLAYIDANLVNDLINSNEPLIKHNEVVYFEILKSFCDNLKISSTDFFSLEKEQIIKLIDQMDQESMRRFIQVALEQYGQAIYDSDQERIQLQKMADDAGIKMAYSENVHMNFGICIDIEEYSFKELKEIIEFLRYLKFRKKDSAD